MRLGVAAGEAGEAAGEHPFLSRERFYGRRCLAGRLGGLALEEMDLDGQLVEDGPAQATITLERKHQVTARGIAGNQPEQLLIGLETGKIDRRNPELASDQPGDFDFGNQSLLGHDETERHAGGAMLRQRLLQHLARE